MTIYIPTRIDYYIHYLVFVELKKDMGQEESGNAACVELDDYYAGGDGT
jgi:hypothetical protein